MEEEKKTVANKTKFQDYKRFHSSKKKGTFITFSNLDAVPEILKDSFNQAPEPPAKVRR